MGFSLSKLGKNIKQLISDRDYWKTRCELAEKFIEESPCDPDILDDQIKAHNEWQSFIKENNEPIH